MQKLKQIIAGHEKVHTSGLNLKFFDCEKHTFEDFRDQIRTKSMFQEKKLFVLKNAFSSADFRQAFLQNQDLFSKTQNLIVFYEDKNLSEKDSFFIWLQKNSTSQKFDILKGAQLKNWIKEQLAKYDAEIEPRALDLLIERTDNDLWLIFNELQKLVSYKNNKDQITIFIQDVEALTPQKLDPNIFKTIDFIAEKQKQKALTLIHEHLQKGDDPLYLLSMITFQFRNLLIIKELTTLSGARGSALNKLGMHPFVVRKSLWLAQKFSLEELKKIYQKIFQIDLDIKIGKIQPDLALDLFIAQI